MDIGISQHEESPDKRALLACWCAHALKKQQEEVSCILQNIFNVKLITLLLVEQDRGFFHWCGNNKAFVNKPCSTRSKKHGCINTVQHM